MMQDNGQSNQSLQPNTIQLYGDEMLHKDLEERYKLTKKAITNILDALPLTESNEIDIQNSEIRQKINNILKKTGFPFQNHNDKVTKILDAINKYRNGAIPIIVQILTMLTKIYESLEKFETGNECQTLFKDFRGIALYMANLTDTFDEFCEFNENKKESVKKFKDLVNEMRQMKALMDTHVAITELNDTTPNFSDDISKFIEHLESNDTDLMDYTTNFVADFEKKYPKNIGVPSEEDASNELTRLTQKVSELHNELKMFLDLYEAYFKHLLKDAETFEKLNRFKEITKTRLCESLKTRYRLSKSKCGHPTKNMEDEDLQIIKENCPTFNDLHDELFTDKFDDVDLQSP